MDGLALRESKLDVPPPPAPEPCPCVDAGPAIERSQNYLLGELKPEGYWVGELMVDSTLVSDTVAYHHWNGKVDKAWERKAVNHILSMQLPDGGLFVFGRTIDGVFDGAKFFSNGAEDRTFHFDRFLHYFEEATASPDGKVAVRISEDMAWLRVKPDRSTAVPGNPD